MDDGEDWVMRPVIKGLVRYESLLDGTISLIDIARMNDALDVMMENETRAHAAVAAEGGRR